MKKTVTNQILIECPNTIFHLYVNNEDEYSKIAIFMNNLQTLKSIGINDIYNWCINQKIEYSTNFNFRKNRGLVNTMKAYWRYSRNKRKYQLGF